MNVFSNVNLDLDLFQLPNVRSLLGVAKCHEWNNRMMDVVVEAVAADKYRRQSAPKLDTEPKDLLLIRLSGEVGPTGIIANAASFKVINSSHSRRTAFKIKATCANFMACTPKAGLLEPTESTTVTVMLHQGQMQGDRRGGRGHAFLVQGMHAEEHETEWSHLADRWKTVDRDQIAERRIHISFVREEEQEEVHRQEEEVRRRSPSPILAPRQPTQTSSTRHEQDFRPRRRSTTSTHSLDGGGAMWGRRNGSMHGRYSNAKIIRATLNRKSSPSSSSSSSSDEQDDYSYRGNRKKRSSKPPMCSSATQTKVTTEENASSMSIPDSCRSWKRSATLATQTEEEVAKPGTLKKPQSQDEQSAMIVLKKTKKEKPEKKVAVAATQCTEDPAKQPHTKDKRHLHFHQFQLSTNRQPTIIAPIRILPPTW